MSKTSNNVHTIFANSVASGDLGNASLDAIGKIDDLGAIINDALGMPTLDISTTEIILLSILLDDSSSMESVRDDVIKAHNELIKSVRESKQVDNIMVQCHLMTAGLLYPFKLINDVENLKLSDYRTDHNTPLYRSSVEVLAITQAKSQECLDNYQDPRTITLIITDGYDNASRPVVAADVNAIVSDMLNSEKHIIAGMGFDSTGHNSNHFEQIFLDMGLKQNWILTINTTPSEIRRAFGVFSRSVTSASKSAASFSQTAMGGFTTP